MRGCFGRGVLGGRRLPPGYCRRPHCPPIAPPPLPHPFPPRPHPIQLLRDHLAVSGAPAAYAAVLAAVPAVFVGPAARLARLVRLAADALAAAFASADQALPPWRAPAALVSKWLPVRSVDAAVRPPPDDDGSPLDLVSPPATPRAAAAHASGACTLGCCAALDGSGGASPAGPLDAPSAALKPAAAPRATSALSAQLAGRRAGPADPAQPRVRTVKMVGFAPAA